MDTNALNKMERLLDRLMEGRLVPFVGAGISSDAVDPHDHCFEPKSAYLEGRIAEALAKHFASAPDLLFQSDLPPKAGGTATGTHLPDLPRLAEIAVLILGKERICEALRVKQFARLTPRPAHRYIAYLAREGLLTEVFSTNYDCCIENAFLESARGSGLTNGEGSDSLKPIWDARSYREDGGLSQTNDGTPTLRLYKINGCAAAYASDQQTADEILWTNRELHSFGNRHWARDCLAVRTRVTTLLVCGFSVEEPQVRYTLLQTIEEQRHTGLVGRPFFIVFDIPKFPERQIIASSLAAAQRDETRGPLGEQIAEWLLCGENAKSLGYEKELLYADDFFERLFQGALGKLLKRDVGPNGRFRRWLNGVEPRAGLWCNRLLEELYPDRHGQNPLDVLFGRYRETLFRVTQTNPPHGRPLAFWCWVWAVVHANRPCPEGHDWYLPLRTDWQLILSLLLLLTSLGQLNASSNGGSPRAIVGLGLRLGQDPSDPNASASHGWPGIVVVREGFDVPTEGFPEQCANDQSRLLLRVTIPEGLRGPVEGRWQIRRRRNRPDSIRTIRTGRYFTLGIEDLIAESGTPDRLRDTIGAAYARFRSPPTKTRLNPL